MSADPTVIAASIVTVIAALTTGVVTVVNAVAAARDRRSSRDERAALAETTTSTDRKADTILEKAEVIHTATNGTLSALRAELAVANAKIQTLEKLLALSDGTTRGGSLTLRTADPRTVHAHRRETDGKDPA